MTGADDTVDGTLELLLNPELFGALKPLGVLNPVADVGLNAAAPLDIVGNSFVTPIVLSCVNCRIAGSATH